MQLEPAQQESIKVRFKEIQTKNDLLVLLNDIKVFVEKTKEDKPVDLIKLGTLDFFSNDKLSAQVRYRQFSIKKKIGGERVLSAPAEPLKEIQRYLAIILATLYVPADCVTGFTAQRSIVDNAVAHVGKQFVYNIDLKDFFPSIHLHRVKAVLKLPPFNLIGDREPLAFLIARLCCMSTADNKSMLPQGAPTSPILSNIICQKLDRRLSGLAKRFKVAYTRYADDITFSADRNIFYGTFRKELRRIIEDQNFTINQSKVRMQGRGYRQEVTGLTVNEKVNVSKRYLREVRAMLHNWKHKGYEQAEAIFKAHYQQDKSVLGIILYSDYQYAVALSEYLPRVTTQRMKTTCTHNLL